MGPHESELVDIPVIQQQITFHVSSVQSVSHFFAESDTFCDIVDQFESKNSSRSVLSRIKMLQERRCSPRLKAIPEHKRPFYGYRNLSSFLNGNAFDELNAKQSLHRRVHSFKQEIALDLPENVCFSERQEMSHGNEISDVSVDKSSINLEVKSSTILKLTEGDTDPDAVGPSISEKVFESHGNLMRLTQERRCSPRLKGIPEEKRPYYGCTKQRLSKISTDHASCEKSDKISIKRGHDDGTSEVGIGLWHDVANQNRNKDSDLLELASSRLTEKRRCSPRLEELSEAAKRPYYSCKGKQASNSSNDKAYLTKYVKLYLTRFKTDNDHFLSTGMEDNTKEILEIKINANLKSTKYEQFITAKLSEKEMEPVQKKSKICGKGTSNCAERFNYQACRKNPCGVPVGYKFCSLAEIVTLGFDCQKIMEFKGKRLKSVEQYNENISPFVVAIVLSHQDDDSGDGLIEVVYTERRINYSLYHERDYKSDAVSHGMLALKNNIKQGIPVRVICGPKYDKNYNGQVYTYCGLYKALLGRGRALEGFSPVFSLNIEDIASGVESFPIPVTNTIEPAMIVPPGFKYITSVQVPPNIKMPPDAPGCRCKSNCVNPITCSCARLNGFDFPYVVNDGGRLVEPRDIIFECGPNCGCGPDCINRVSQQPLKYRLEVYRTQNKGWAVRSWDFIPSGAPVCEYTGVIRRNSELDNVSDNEFIFDIDCWHTMQGLGGRERRQDDDVPNGGFNASVVTTSESESEFCIDGSSFGNVCRFINHSCDPNLFVQCVLSSHRDIRLARVVLFAADDIPPMQELAYDYGYALDSVVGADGKLKHMACHCGSKICRGRLY